MGLVTDARRVLARVAQQWHGSVRRLRMCLLPCEHGRSVASTLIKRRARWSQSSAQHALPPLSSFFRSPVDSSASQSSCNRCRHVLTATLEAQREACGFCRW
eukprot:scaffold160685_cov24-Tisochrysis_lutea.AAC.3